jgi:hypothetical protein
VPIKMRPNAAIFYNRTGPRFAREASRWSRFGGLAPRVVNGQVGLAPRADKALEHTRRVLRPPSRQSLLQLRDAVASCRLVRDPAASVVWRLACGRSPRCAAR